MTEQITTIAPSAPTLSLPAPLSITTIDQSAPFSIAPSAPTLSVPAPLSITTINQSAPFSIAPSAPTLSLPHPSASLGPSAPTLSRLQSSFKEVVKKQGPRGQKKEKNKFRERRNALADITNPEMCNKIEQSEKPKEEHISFRELKYQLDLLQRRVHSPKVDLIDINSLFIVKMEIAGLNIKDIGIEVRDSQILLVSGKKYEDEIIAGRSIYKECKYGNFMRRVKLPSQVNNFNFNRDVLYKNGVLTITFNKNESSKNEKEKKNFCCKC
jgi:HSP20 family molecular chaperone IbpA